MKRVSVAEAKNTLPALLHEAEAEPVEIVRRGKPVAVILSSETYERLTTKKEDLWEAYQRFRATHDPADLVDDVFEGTRDRSGGRRVKW